MIQLPWSSLATIVLVVSGLLSVYLTLTERLQGIETRQALLSYYAFNNCRRLSMMLEKHEGRTLNCPSFQELLPR